MSRRYHFTTCLSFGTDGEADYCEIDATVSYTVAWGTPADPWGDDPGSGDEIECPVCRGFGFLETDDGTVECDECDGNGSVAP